jgi:AraC family transcriptional activator of pobA
LFGESARLPDVVHCETIAARSSLHDWELAPHRHGRLHQLILVQSGAGEVELDGRNVAFAAQTQINVPQGTVHAFRFDPGTQGFVVTLAEEIVEVLLQGSQDVRQTLDHAAVTAADPLMGRLMQLIWSEFSGLAQARAMVLRGLCATLLGLAARAMTHSDPAWSGVVRSPLLQRLGELIEAHYLQHWGVADYARALSVSPTHLSRLVRAATGEPTSALIQARVLREAKRRLAYTNERVATIAYALGFSDPAHFSRVFSRAQGVSPRAFRA